MSINIRHFESLLGKAGISNTGDNRRLLQKCIREVLDMGRLTQDELLEEAYKVFTDDERKQEFEEKVLALLFKYC